MSPHDSVRRGAGVGKQGAPSLPRPPPPPSTLLSLSLPRACRTNSGRSRSSGAAHRSRSAPSSVAGRACAPAPTPLAQIAGRACAEAATQERERARVSVLMASPTSESATPDPHLKFDPLVLTSSIAEQCLFGANKYRLPLFGTHHAIEQRCAGKAALAGADPAARAARTGWPTALLHRRPGAGFRCLRGLLAPPSARQPDTSVSQTAGRRPPTGTARARPPG